MLHLTYERSRVHAPLYQWTRSRVHAPPYLGEGEARVSWLDSCRSIMHRHVSTESLPRFDRITDVSVDCKYALLPKINENRCKAMQINANQCKSVKIWCETVKTYTRAWNGQFVFAYETVTTDLKPSKRRRAWHGRFVFVYETVKTHTKPSKRTYKKYTKSSTTTRP